MTMPKDISAAVFGSTVRGDSDSISDRDVLFVCRTPEAIAHCLDPLRKSGWSPTVYSWARLSIAASRGDLFIQHLRQEADILSDPDHSLKAILESFRPCSSYETQHEAAKRLFGTIEYVPEGMLGTLWALDVASVSFRSLAVTFLANNGLYRFARKEIVQSLARLRAGSDLLEVSSILRAGKYHHRRIGGRLQMNTEEMRALVNSVDRYFRVGVQINTISPEAFVDRVLNNNKTQNDWYAKSRLLEMVVNLLSTTNGDTCKYLYQWAKRLRSPSDYGGYISRHNSRLRRELLELWEKGCVHVRQQRNRVEP
jgi:hypothetical protein